MGGGRTRTRRRTLRYTDATKAVNGEAAVATKEQAAFLQCVVQCRGMERREELADKVGISEPVRIVTAYLALGHLPACVG